MSVRNSMITAFVLLVALPIQASAEKAAKQTLDASARRAIAAEYLQRSNYLLTVEAWKSTIKQMVRPLNCPCDGEDAAKAERAWGSAVDKAFQASEVEIAVLAAATQGFDKDELKRLNAFWKGTFAEKLKRKWIEVLNTKPAKPDMDEELKKLNAVVARMEANPGRKKLLEDILVLQGGAKLQAEEVLNIMHAATLGGAAARAPNTPALSPETISSHIEQAKAPLTQMLGMFASIGLAELFEELTDDELRTLKAHLQTDLGKKEHNVLLAAQNEALWKQGLKIGHAFMTGLQAQDL